MNNPLRCPNCKTNKSRFNIIHQEAQAIKVDPTSGKIIQQFTNDNLDPFHTPYNGPKFRIQCGVCGLVEDEKTFIKFGEQA